mmetsp:Transcript_26781/g.58745  ORF Transcript_26781/g.58745 Transcript_26781/m.58745 type:complete len:320 (+) Transcript_26781:214-1173(+)
MRFSRGPFLILHTLALIAILVKGGVREVDALIQKPKALKPGPWSASWSRNANANANANTNSNIITNRNRIPQNYNNGRRHEQSEKSMRMNMAGSTMPVFQSKNKIPKGSLVFATALAGVLYLKPKGILLFLSNGLYKPYQNYLVTNPLVTKMITGAILSIIGDAVAQASSAGDDEFVYDKRRALSFAAFDSFYRFFQHNMFPVVIKTGRGNVVGKLLPMLAPAAAAIEQTMLYQLLVVPLIYYPAFFTFTGLLQGLSVRQSLDRLKAQFFRCWRRNLMFWIPMQMVLFGLIAENWQIPFACLVGMIWSTILSKTAGSTK